MIPAAHIECAREVRIEDELARRGVKLQGRGGNLEGPCPVCGGTDRFGVSCMKQVFQCRRCGGKGGGSIDLVMFLDGCDFNSAVTYLAGPASERTVCSIAKQPALAVKKSDDKSPNGASLWRASIDPRGTLVEAYLKSRALELPDEAANEATRFHPNCPMAGEHHPAMICLIRNIVTNEPQAIIRTALTPDGRAIKRNGKTFRLSLGPVAGGAVKIDPDEDVTQGLCIGEGVETCLAGRQKGLRPVWSVVSTSGVAKFPVLSGIVALTILRESDANLASPKASEECFVRWHGAEREMIFADPECGTDLNDELRESGR